MRLGAVLGCGGHTLVYRGELDAFGQRRAVAVKIWSGDDLAPSAERRIAAAVERATCVVHPSVVATYDSAFRRGAPPIVVGELVAGATLERCLASRGVPPFAVALLVGLRVAGALSAAWFGAHPDGAPLALAHGSVCARDVFVTASGDVRLADFGHAAATFDSSQIRALDAISPRLAALAPELVDGQTPDARSDVFALGVLLHELLVGPRFTGVSSLGEAMRDAFDGTVRENPFTARALTKPLRDVLHAALAADPSRRFPHAQAFATALHRVARPLGVTGDRDEVAAWAHGPELARAR